MLLILVSFFSMLSLQAQEIFEEKPPFQEYLNSAWVDSVMTSLTPNERIAQLIMVAAYSNRGDDHKQEILKIVNEQKIGGIIFYQEDPAAQIRLMNDYQKASEVPLLGAIDAEWGLGMRLDNTINYPYQMALCAIQDDELIYKLGIEVAKQIKRSALHLNFAPLVDVNTNQVVNYRSFGENQNNLAKKSNAYFRGMQDEQLLPTEKHCLAWRYRYVLCFTSNKPSPFTSGFISILSF